jgi:hypothetical protein
MLMVGRREARVRCHSGRGVDEETRRSRKEVRKKARVARIEAVRGEVKRECINRM